MSTTAILMRTGRVALGDRVVLERVDFRLDEGEFVVVLGPNGSGKTTLVRAVLGLVGLSEGRIDLFGAPLERFSAWERIGYVPQRATAAANVPATVQEVVLSGRIARAGWWGPYRRPDRVAASRALDAVAMSEHLHSPVAILSGGQQQRVLIARALATEPDVLVLDEPISGVDIENQESFATTLRALKERRCSVLVVAHGLGVLEPLVDRAVVLREGRVVYDGPPGPEHVHPEHPHHHPEPDVRQASFGSMGGST